MAGRWFRVDEQTLLIDSHENPVGYLRPNKRYLAVSEDESWVGVAGPDGSVGYVARSQVDFEVAEEPPTPPQSTAGQRVAIGSATASAEPPSMSTPARSATVVAKNDGRDEPPHGGRRRGRLLGAGLGIVVVVALGVAGVVWLNGAADGLPDGTYVLDQNQDSSILALSPDLDLWISVEDSTVVDGHIAFDGTDEQSDALCFESGLSHGALAGTGTDFGRRITEDDTASFQFEPAMCRGAQPRVITLNLGWRVPTRVDASVIVGEYAFFIDGVLVASGATTAAAPSPAPASSSAGSASGSTGANSGDGRVAELIDGDWSDIPATGLMRVEVCSDGRVFFESNQVLLDADDRFIGSAEGTIDGSGAAKLTVSGTMAEQPISLDVDVAVGAEAVSVDIQGVTNRLPFVDQLPRAC